MPLKLVLTLTPIIRFINRDDINFENVESIKATQEWILAENDFGGDIEYMTQYETINTSIRWYSFFRMLNVIESKERY